MGASRLANRDSQGAEQGVEGRSVQLTAQEIDNTRGALRADEQLLVTSAGSLDNSKGLVSAGQALHLRDAALAGSRTLRITNTEGRLIAGPTTRANSISTPPRSAAMANCCRTAACASHSTRPTPTAASCSPRAMPRSTSAMPSSTAASCRPAPPSTFKRSASKTRPPATPPGARPAWWPQRAWSTAGRSTESACASKPRSAAQPRQRGASTRDHRAIQAETLNNNVEADKSATIAARARARHRRRRADGP